MGLPKRRTSRSKKLKRRAQWKLKTPALSACRQCGSPKLPHRVCSNCGTYGGREIVAATES
jgi:large subunit ribosomal protein L32